MVEGDWVAMAAAVERGLAATAGDWAEAVVWAALVVVLAPVVAAERAVAWAMAEAERAVAEMEVA